MNKISSLVGESVRATVNKHVDQVVVDPAIGSEMVSTPYVSLDSGAEHLEFGLAKVEGSWFLVIEQGDFC
ncbi:hypothetical protein IGS67_05245 [Flavimobilis sp. GY10621]|uniref:Uncharacterized protein n=1 Tax=Flavimobilis rhizosphaerae TaxID=2775421 RepID=A0ABR9DP50_9MICO|nr:hypothetical protein [Flavimobilis rhizosphaerae]MBD9698899.1 hypothetical protein [Flavimobilis rhizosphaerae]